MILFIVRTFFNTVNDKQLDVMSSFTVLLNRKLLSFTDDDVLYCPMHRTSHMGYNEYEYGYEYEGMVAYWPETETGQTATIPCEAEMGLIGKNQSGVSLFTNLL